VKEETELDLPAVMRDRREKLERLRAAGIDPYSRGFKPTHTNQSAKALLGDAEAPAAASDGAEVVLFADTFNRYFERENIDAALAVLQVVSNPNLESITKGPYGISLSGVFDPTFAYATALAILAATIFLVIYLRNSRFGMALQAIREDAISASMAGINVVRERVIAWLLSALIAGLAGGVFAWYVSVFYPETVFSGEFTIFAIVFALFGGTATVLGPIFGVLILYGIYNAVGISTPQYFQLIYGVLIMGLVLFLPNGLVSLFRRRGIDVP